jgi:hypothetical protein
LPLRRVCEGAPDRAAAVHLLMPFVRRRHVDVCVESRIDVAVLGFGGDQALVERLRDAGVFVLAMVGSEDQARGIGEVASGSSNRLCPAAANPESADLLAHRPTAGMPDAWVDHAALYAGESALRMTSVISARQAVSELAGG